MPGDAVADLVMRARRALRGDGGSSPSRGEADARAILSEGVRRLGEVGWGAEATELDAATQALAMMAGVHGEGSIHERWAAVPTGAARVAGWLGEEDGGAAMLERAKAMFDDRGLRHELDAFLQSGVSNTHSPTPRRMCWVGIDILPNQSAQHEGVLSLLPALPACSESAPGRP